MVILGTSFEDALTYAARLHAEQRRKGSGVPYISHLIAVAGLALEHGANEEEAIAALLHDAVEDCGGLEILEEIRRRFGERVAQIVEGCTDTHESPKPPWRPRKEAYLEHLRNAPPAVRLVSACDKLHNARAILRDYRQLGESLWPRFRGGRSGTLWYYRAVTEVLRSFGETPLVCELAETVERIETAVDGPDRRPSEHQGPGQSR